MPRFISVAIAGIVAREFLEAIMFITSFFGAVINNKTLDANAKIRYYKYMVVGVLCGVLGGLFISLGVGFGLKTAFEEGGGLEAQIGLEAGEACSKFVGFFFVTKMMFKIPKWFGISNFGRVENKAYDKPNDPYGNADNTKVLDSEKVMTLNLFWNLLREMSETGCFVAIEAFLSVESMNALGDSVGVGLGCAAGFSILVAYTGVYINGKIFGVICSVIVEMLAVGLFTGSMHSFEEVRAMREGIETPFVWGNDQTSETTNSVVKVFGFFGIRGKFSTLEFVAWMVSIIVLTTFQISHNYFGIPLPSIKALCKSKANSDDTSKTDGEFNEGDKNKADQILPNV